MYLPTQRKPPKRSTALSQPSPNDQGTTPLPASKPKPWPVKPEPIDPQPISPPPHRPSHLVHEASTGAVRVQFPANEPNSEIQAIEQRLNKRLRASARSGGAEAHQRACQAADELVEILHLLKLSPKQCLSLVKSRALWASFLEPSRAPVFSVQPAHEPGTTQAAELHLAEPVNRRVVAALMTAMIQGAMDGAAAALLQACPRDLDRRVVLKHLLTQPGPSGGVLRRVREPEAVAAFELALKDLMACTNTHGRPRYAAQQADVDQLLAHWHLEALLSFGGCGDLGSARGGELVDAVLGDLHRITTVQNAGPFIQKLTNGLATLQSITDQRASTQGLSAGTLARQRLLPAMVKHFGALVSGQGEAHNADWTALALWVWATGAVLSLVPGSGAWVEPGDRTTPHATLLSFLHQTTALLPATLSLLCQPTLLSARKQRPPPKPGFFRPEDFKLSDVQALWAQCPLATRQAVLKLPLPQLWPIPIPSLAIDKFAAEHELSPEQRAAQIVALIDANTALPGLPSLLADALGTATLSKILSERPPQHEDAWWLVHALHALVDRMRKTGQLHRPRALPNLLSLLRRITLRTKGLEHMHLWDVWTGFAIECARLAQLEAQDWVLAGTYLPLGPEAKAAKRQIQRLSQDLSGGVMLHLLQGWLAQRLADACNPIPETSSEPLVPTFQLVWDITKGLLASLSRAERQALGEEVPVVLETLRQRNDELFKKK